jgi:protein-disulfide isomerase
MTNPSTAPVPAWPIRQVILGIFLFAAGIVIGYKARDVWQAPAADRAGAVIDVTGSANNYSWGDASAKVTMVEFGDFQCPYCQQWHQEVYGQIQAEYGDKIRFIYRDFPLPFHADAEPAAEAARCAGDQGRFWEYYNLLYLAPQGVDAAARRTYAQRIGLNLSAFDNCTQSGRFAEAVRQDALDGTSAGVNGTPAFFINGRLISGAQPFVVFKQAIDAALAS